MTTEYLKNSDNKVYSFDRELNPQELIDFQNGDLEGVFVKDFSSDENAIDVGAILNNDIVFGLKLTKTFLEDNRRMSIAFTPTMNQQMLVKFDPIERLARLGDIKTVLYLLGITVVDTVFTQERKDSYIEMCNQYLGL